VTGRFDAVIVGGGTAGCVLAARIAAARPDASVLLLEAGPDLRADPPREIREGWGMTRDFDWGYQAEPDATGNIEDLRRLRLLGGTSNLVRFALRGSPADYDGWRALGNPGWGWDDVLPAFRRLEADAEFGDRPWHGADGPIPVTRYPALEGTEVHRAAIGALAGSGFEPVEDHNAPGALGFGALPMSARDGLRVSTVGAYLPLGATPPNLAIRAESQVANVRLDGTRAHGVTLVDGSAIEAELVIVATGTYGSPTVLMRSGIGPANDLEPLGIEVVVDLPGVGQNLADHPGVDVDAGYEGEVRSAPRLHSIATFRSGLAAPDDAPDLLLWVAEPIAVAGGTPAFEIDPVLMTPRSRGWVRLRSSDPLDPPRIRLPGLDGEGDVERLVEAYERAWEVANRPELRAVCRAPVGPDHHGGDLRAAIRAAVYSYPHVVGTCAMGPDPALGAVVDPGGRVHGIDGLYVVDASIMPTQVSGFSHLVTIMIAEKLAPEIAAAAGRGR